MILCDQITTHNLFAHNGLNLFSRRDFRESVLGELVGRFEKEAKRVLPSWQRNKQMAHLHEALFRLQFHPKLNRSYDEDLDEMILSFYFYNLSRNKQEEIQRICENIASGWAEMTEEDYDNEYSSLLDFFDPESYEIYGGVEVIGEYYISNTLFSMLIFAYCDELDVSDCYDDLFLADKYEINIPDYIGPDSLIPRDYYKVIKLSREINWEDCKELFSDLRNCDSDEFWKISSCALSKHLKSREHIEEFIGTYENICLEKASFHHIITLFTRLVKTAIELNDRELLEKIVKYISNWPATEKREVLSLLDLLPVDLQEGLASGISPSELSGVYFHGWSSILPASPIFIQKARGEYEVDRVFHNLTSQFTPVDVVLQLLNRLDRGDSILHTGEDLYDEDDSYGEDDESEM